MVETIGKITIAPGVLVTIVRFAVLKQLGVARLSSREPSRPGPRLRGRAATAPGVGVWVRDGRVTVEVRVVADGSVNAHELGTTVQQGVTQAIEEMVGMPVEAVHVYIDDVDVNGIREGR